MASTAGESLGKSVDVGVELSFVGVAGGKSLEAHEKIKNEDRQSMIGLMDILNSH